MSETVKVAERIMASAQRDLWALADAVVADVPAMPGRGDRGADSDSYGDIGNRITGLVAELADRGIAKADGTPYTASYLSNLRDGALAWPQAERQAEAAFTTHVQAMGRDTGRPVFLALCAVARGDRARRPADCEERSWADACERVRRNTAERKRLPVGENEVRMARGRKPKSMAHHLTEPTITELLGHLAAMHEGLEAFVERYTDTLADDDRARLARWLHRTIDKAQMAYEMVTGGVDVERIEAWLAETDR